MFSQSFYRLNPYIHAHSVIKCLACDEISNVAECLHKGYGIAHAHPVFGFLAGETNVNEQVLQFRCLFSLFVGENVDGLDANESVSSTTSGVYRHPLSNQSTRVESTYWIDTQKPCFFIDVRH